MDSEYENAIKYLEEADLNDEQVVFNLSKSYYQSGNWKNGEKYFQKLASISRNSKYISYLKKMRILTKPDGNK